MPLTVELWTELSDATIEEMWRSWAAQNGAKLEAVLITAEAANRQGRRKPTDE